MQQDGPWVDRDIITLKLKPDYEATFDGYSQASLLSNELKAIPKACTADRGHW